MMYYLMNMDRVVAQLVVIKKDCSGGNTVFKLGRTINRLPIGFFDVNMWLERRKASWQNKHIRKVMKINRLNDTETFLKITHAVSMDDTFWVKQVGEDGTAEGTMWCEVSPYNNSIDESISKISFSDKAVRTSITSPIISPELTMWGTCKKRFIKEGNDIYLYKRGSSDIATYCEVLSSEIGAILCKESVKYELAKLDGHIASKCRLFTNEKEGFTSYAKIERDSPEVESLSYFEGLGCCDEYRRMVILDDIIFNTPERNMSSYGVISDNFAAAPIRMAPVFDFDKALLSNISGDDTSVCYRCNGSARYYMTRSIMKDLKNLKGFKFSFRGDDIFEPWRVELLETLINKEICNIIE